MSDTWRKISGSLLAAAGVLFLGLAGTAAAGGPDVGDLAPEFSILTTSGKYFELAELEGRPVLLSFWSDWCSTDREELAFLKRVGEKHPDAVIAVVDAESAMPSIRSLTRIAGSLTRNGVEALILVDRGLDVTELYGVTSLPTSMVIDPSRRIAYRQSNYFSGEGDEAAASLERIDARSQLSGR